MTQAKDFNLMAHTGEMVRLSEQCRRGPVMLVFYPGDFTPVCTAQLCDYRDRSDDFSGFQINILGISQNSREEHQAFAKQHRFTFPLLTDPGNGVAKEYGSKSALLFGGVSRSVFIVNRRMEIVYQHVEWTPLTKRSGEELTKVLADLDAQDRL